MKVTEAINYFDLISTMPQQNAYDVSWYIIAIILIASSILATIHYCIDRFTRTDGEKSIINDFGRKHPIKSVIITISIFLTIIYWGQHIAQNYLYNNVSVVKKDDVISSEYFKNLDDYKKELMRLYLLCNNSLEASKPQKTDCNPLTINTNEFSPFILTSKLHTFIKELDATNSIESGKNIYEINETRALIERIKTAK